MKFLPKALISILSVSLIQTIPFVFSTSTAKAQSTTYVVCYFQKPNQPNTRTWKWGLTRNNDWYSINGNWRNVGGSTTFITRLTSKSIQDSCEHSKTYYKFQGYDVVDIYAADSAVGSNYQIHADNGQTLVVAPQKPTQVSSTYTYTACYFRKTNDPNSTTWRWGLTDENGWYSMAGNWGSMGGATIFEARGTVAEVRKSCENSKAYYNFGSEYQITGVYARDSGAGNNYHIYANDGATFVSE